MMVVIGKSLPMHRWGMLQMFLVWILFKNYFLGIIFNIQSLTVYISSWNKVCHIMSNLFLENLEKKNSSTTQFPDLQLNSRANSWFSQVCLNLQSSSLSVVTDILNYRHLLLENIGDDGVNDFHIYLLVWCLLCLEAFCFPVI